MPIRKFKVLKLLWLFLLLVLQEPAAISAKHVQKRGVMDSFNDGLKIAGQMFGVNTAADVANLVAKAFSTATSTSNRSKTPDFMQIFQQHQNTADSQEQQATQQHQEQHQQDQQDQDEGQSTRFGSPAKEVSGLNFNSANFVTNVLRMIGFDASKLGALAINALIMIAQAIGNTLMNATKGNNFISVSEGGRYQQHKHNHGDIDDESPSSSSSPPSSSTQHNDDANDYRRSSRQLRDDRPLDWFLQSHGQQNENTNRQNNGKGNFKGIDHIDRLLSHATDTQLADKLVNMIEQLETSHNEGACLKMLMCKSSPFIWGMQRSLNARFGAQPSNATDDTTKTSSESAKRRTPATTTTTPNDGGLNANTLFTDLPSVSDYRLHGRVCEQRYAQHCSQLKSTENSAKNQHEMNTRKH